MILTVIAVLAFAALITAIVAAVGKAPLWVSVILLALIELLRVIPKE